MKAAAVALLLAALSLHGGARAGSLDALEQDGWYTWQVEAAAGAPAWCCYLGRGNTAAQARCNLDRHHAGYGHCEGPRRASDLLQLYARIEAGETVKLRALSPSCTVEADSRITDLGAVDVAESFEWLRGHVGRDARVGKDALAAIALHRGEGPLQYLTDAANGGAAGEVREDAIFWLGMARISEASATLERLMFSDDEPRIRQHAAFVLSQSASPNSTDALIRQGRQDADADTRAEAWFWLAQTGASEGEAAIMGAVADDPDARVREEAVFALAQLPGDRSADALIAVLENQRLDQAAREAALFWLAQSQSDRGLAVIERLITGGNARLY